MRIFFILLAILLPGPALAAGQVALNSTVLVERSVTASDGRQRLTLEEPKLVTPGDRLVFVLNYRNSGTLPAEKLIVTNPLPSAVAFAGVADARAEVSIDGGRSWGTLATLKVTTFDGRLRPARPDEVTHIRWALAKPVPPGAQGKLSFRGIVR